MPESKNLKMPRRSRDAVVEIVANPRGMQATHADQREVTSVGANVWLRRNEAGRSFEFLADGIGRLWSVGSPPRFSFANLARGERTDLDVKPLAHSRLRSSPRSWVRGIVSPRSH